MVVVLVGTATPQGAAGLLAEADTLFVGKDLVEREVEGVGV